MRPARFVRPVNTTKTRSLLQGCRGLIHGALGRWKSCLQEYLGKLVLLKCVFKGVRLDYTSGTVGHIQRVFSKPRE